jgi:hypothetical protein
MEREALLALIADDDLGLLKVKPRGSAASTSADRLVASFGEINDFIRLNERVPSPSKDDLVEYRLFSRLEALKKDSSKVEKLVDFDEFSLLGEVRNISSIDDIFADDDLGILSGANNEIFDLKHIPKETTMPDYVAQRRPCEDFDLFEPLFVKCQGELASGKRRVWRFSKEQQIEAGLFFVLRGILLYVAEVGDREIVNGKNNARLRCIFANGTESDMLLRSLSAELYKDGRRVSLSEDDLLDGFETVSLEDQETGFVYVVRSLSEREDIKSLKHLHKVGFSRFPPEARLKGAESDPTFLMAPVALAAAFQCYNLNANQLEHLLHRFFGRACVEIEVVDFSGVTRRPREWFLAPLSVIEEAVHLMRTEEIVHFRYDPALQEIVPR